MSTFQNSNVGRKVAEVDVSPNFDAYSGVEIIVSEETTYFAGSDSGRVLTIENPWGTQEQADNILASLRGFSYKPYTARAALLDPATEIGDGVTIGTMYSGVHTLSRTFGRLMTADISAPQSEDIDHEYPFETKEQREIQRRFTAVRSELNFLSDEISAKVSQEGGNQSFSWELFSDRFSLKSNNTEVFRVDSSGATITGKITAKSGEIGGFTIGSNAITYNGLTWNGAKNGIYLGTNGIQFGSVDGNFFQASASGSVKMSGTLTIGGATITADKLRNGANAGYSWSNGSYGGSSSRAAYALSGAGGGFAFSRATDSSSGSYPNFFKSYRVDADDMRTSVLMVSGYFASWKTLSVTTPGGGSYTMTYLGR